MTLPPHPNRPACLPLVAVSRAWGVMLSRTTAAANRQSGAAENRCCMAVVHGASETPLLCMWAQDLLAATN